MNLKETTELMEKLNMAFGTVKTDDRTIEFFHQEIFMGVTAEEGEKLFKKLVGTFESIPRATNYLKLFKSNLDRKPEPKPVELDFSATQESLAKKSDEKPMVDYTFKSHWKPETRAYVTCIHLLHFGYIEKPATMSFPQFWKSNKQRLTELVGAEESINLPTVAVMLQGEENDALPF